MKGNIISKIAIILSLTAIFTHFIFLEPEVKTEVKVVPTRHIEYVEKVVVETECVTVIEEPSDYQFLKEFYENQKMQHENNCLTAYYESYTIWKYLTETMEFSEEAAAGVIGNMMAECGGNTLYLQINALGCGGGFYGICQWAYQYHSSVFYTDLNTQLQYFYSTFPSEVNQFGFMYRQGFRYTDFIQMDNVAEAVVAYEKAYGRGGIQDYSRRIANASLVYELFHFSGA